ILSAVYMLWMFQRVNYGDVTNPKNRALPDLTPREWAMMIPTVGLAVVMGVFPNIFLKPMEPSIVRTIDRINGTVTSSSRREERGGRRGSALAGSLLAVPNTLSAPAERDPAPLAL